MKVIGIIILGVMFFAGTSYGDTYKYLDDKGTPSFTDDLKGIPQKYRKSAVLMSMDDGKVITEAPPQADKIDESLLPQKEEVSVKTNVTPNAELLSQNFPYMNVIIISSLFLSTLIPTFFLNNKMVKRVLRVASTVSILTLLVYVSAFFVSRHMHTLKNDAAEMTEKMKKKEEDKGRAIQDALGSESQTPSNL